MIAFRTVLCPVDFSSASERQTDLAADLCRAFGARLVLHHNVSAMSPGAGVGWMWAADHQGLSEPTVEDRLRAFIGRVAPGVSVEGCITHGPASESVVAVGESFDADVVVLSTHGVSNDDHTSVTEHVLEHAHRTVLALHEGDADGHVPNFATSAKRQIAIVPTDLTPESRAAIDLAFDLARRLPLEVHLLHVLVRGERLIGIGGATGEDARRRLGALIPEDLASRAVIHLDAGDPATAIVRVATELSAACIVMGEHTRVTFRRWFSHDTSRAVLRRAPCPVWYVPGQRAA